jgi:hypothetical protein
MICTINADARIAAISENIPVHGNRLQNPVLQDFVEE